MKLAIRFLWLLPACTAMTAAEPVIPDLSGFADDSVWRIQDRAASKLDEPGSAMKLDSRRGEGVAWLVGSDFSHGTIEVDLRGADVPGRSFVGVAFRGLDERTYEAVYFRAFNFKNSDEVRRARAVQYVSMPDHPWQRLREEHPGKYESAINPVPDPNGWFHARIVVSDRTIKVFVNDSNEACLTVTALSARAGGKIGLWVGDGSGGDFKNLTISPDKEP
jgi:hypothetical protein